MPRSSPSLLVRLRNAAALLDTSPETVRYWVRMGRLTPVHVGRSVYFQRSELERFVTAQSQAERDNPTD